MLVSSKSFSYSTIDEIKSFFSERDGRLLQFMKEWNLYDEITE
jgi:hypothetical protein